MGGVVPGLGDIPGVISDAADISAKVSIYNYTNETLLLIDQSGDENDSGNGRPSTGSFVNLPQPELAPGQHDEFEFKVDHVRISHVEVHSDAQGFVKYQLGDTNKTWQVTFTNPFSGDAHGESVLTPAGDGFTTPTPQHGGGKHAPIQAVLHQQGFDPNHPGKPPEPPAVTSRCIVTVTNNTQQVLTLVNQGHERGGFLSFPKAALQPGETDSFASVETQGVTDPKLQGQKGSLVYQIGSNPAETWHLDWDNPENAQNTCSAVVQGAPEGVQFQSLGQIGEGEDNVPVTFTLGGGGGEEPPPGEDVEWAPPQEHAGEPTLRSTDNNPDGWVEYAQQLLNNHGASLAVDGDFGAGTLAAVRHVQQQFDIQQDGVIGNQTWAVLRGEHPAPASTDGLPAHSFEETGPQARWFAEGTAGTGYDPSSDVLRLFLVSTGEQPIDDFQATIRLIGNDAGELFTTQNPIGPPVATNEHGGANYVIEIEGLHEAYGDGVHTVEAYLPAELGGDYTTVQVRVGNV